MELQEELEIVMKVVAKDVMEEQQSVNALLEAGRERIQNNGNVVLYCTTCPCLGCAKKIVQSGVNRVVFKEEYGMDKLTKELFDEANVKLEKFSFLECSFGFVEKEAMDSSNTLICDEELKFFCEGNLVY
ncbi:Deoxycytidine monophosphate (dCMP) deaminase [Clydaea vesicula]|uniref:dCMP deaminase n=1 Tax=Clydaea vesicula TaxID=447962 RepID=A0AAD5XV86_9FUNG|nr:Deoxycytidine monophosphate (dCMP) deaminase [Clydaea vesicula]